MCLQIIDTELKQQMSYKQRYGWKIFDVGFVPKKLFFQFFIHNQARQVPRRKWLRSFQPHTAIVFNQQRNKNERYLLRFHIYLVRPPAYMISAGERVCKVHWRGPVTTGWQNDLPIVVANRLRVN
jgi:hypothetical protein